MTTATQELLNTVQAAKFLGLSPATLETWRCRKSNGPRFVKVGSLVRYRMADLHEYVDTRTVSCGAEFDEID